MANTKSAKKAVKVNERRRLRNQAMRSAVKTSFRKANEAVGDTKEKETVNLSSLSRSAASLIDKAVGAGVVHRNTAARKKSRLARKVNAILNR